MFYFTLKAQFMWHQKQHSTSSGEINKKFFKGFTYTFLDYFAFPFPPFSQQSGRRSWQPGTNVVRHFNRPCDIFELLERDITNSQFKGGEDLPRHLSLGASLCCDHCRTTYVQHHPGRKSNGGRISCKIYLFLMLAPPPSCDASREAIINSLLVRILNVCYDSDNQWFKTRAPSHSSHRKQ